MSNRKKRILVLIKPRDPGDPGAGNMPLGRPRDLIDALAPFNTAPDGAERRALGTAVLHGPGFTIEYSTSLDELNQAMIVVNDQDFAWPVLSKLCHANAWKMQDTESGQVFG